MRFYTLDTGMSYPVQSFSQVEQNADISYFSVDGYRVSDKLGLAHSSNTIKNLTVYSADITPNKYSAYSMNILEDDHCMFLGQEPNSGLMLHSCDTVAGSSGSPIIANGKVVGIHLGAMNENYKNASEPAKLVNIACPVDLVDSVDVNKAPYQAECGCAVQLALNKFIVALAKLVSPDRDRGVF